MILYPAIDLAGGRCVRLAKGDFNAQTVYHDDALEQARVFAQSGAQWLHVVDLDGARDGKVAQTEIILRVARDSGLRVQTGGGIRSAEQIEVLLAGGVARAVVGSVAVTDPPMVQGWLKKFGAEKVTLALDVRADASAAEGYRPALRGWQESATVSLYDLLRSYSDAGALHILCTVVDRDGMLTGPETALYEKLAKEFPALQFQASGGIASLEDLAALQACGAAGAVIGKALYEKKFMLAEALEKVGGARVQKISA